MSERIYIGIDCGATTSKISGIDKAGELLCQDVLQKPTLGEAGKEAITANWVSLGKSFLDKIGSDWAAVESVGLAMPGPYLAYGKLGVLPNMPASLAGWSFLDDLSQALAKVSGRKIPVVTANDGHLAGVGESAILHKSKRGSILMLAPGSGLGCSFVNAEGILLSGDNNSAVLLGHIPAPLNKLGLPPFFCGCGRDWGCFEAFTTISGLPQFLKHFLPEYKDHRLHASSGTEKEMALSLRGLAQEGDELALKIFDFQARALGYAVAAGCMAFDPTHVLIGGGLMDKGSTTQHFRNRYLNGVRKSAAEYLWVDSGKVAINEAVLGELAQAIGAAHLARNLSA